jgi:hypothetical protein
MEMRARLLKGATALLYFGPLLAGLGGYGWVMVPSFVAIFVLWQMIVRPHNWPTSLTELGQKELWVGIAAQISVQVLLVVGCFGIGRGIGGALGAVPMYAPALPLSVSFLSIPFSRLLWNPWSGDRFDARSDLDVELPQVPSDAAGFLALADRLLQPLQDMNGRISEADALRHLGAMSTHVDQSSLHEALIARVAKGGASEALRAVLVVHAADPAIMANRELSSKMQVLLMLQSDDGKQAFAAPRVANTIGLEAEQVFVSAHQAPLHAA